MLTSSILATDYFGVGATGAFRFISLALGLAALAAGIFTAVDANKYPDQAHEAAGVPKMAWLVGGPVLGLIGCACCFPLGLIAPIAWFAVYKKKVEDAAGGVGFAGPPGGFGGPPPGGYGAPPPPGGFGGATPPPPGGGYPPPGQTPPPGGGYPPPGPMPPPGGQPPPPGGGYPPPASPPGGGSPPPPGPQQ